MWERLRKQYPKTIVLLIGTVVFVQLMIWLVKYYDKTYANGDGYVSNLHVENVGRMLKVLWILLVLPAAIFKITRRTTVKGISANILIFGILIILLEGCNFALVKTKLVNVVAPNYPTLRLIEYKDQATPFYAEYKKEWGTWHYAKIFRHKGTCYDVVYTRNEVGARDRERTVNSPQKRLIFLGDSYMEGYCVADSNRMSNRLEAQTGLEHLNFGISATSPTQYYLVYKHLAKQYKHDAVVIGLLPWNDFLPDDYDEAIVPGSGVEHNYRPYWVGTYPNYQLKYHVKNLEDSDWYPKNMDRVFRRDFIIGDTTAPLAKQVDFFLLTHSYTYRVTKNWMDNTLKKIPIIPPAHSSPFWSYRQKDLERVKYSFERISQEAGNKKIFILGLPILNDIKVRKEKGEASPLSKELSAMCQSKNWIYVDLLEYFHAIPESEWESFYLTCDGHWSPEGHRLAAQALAKNQEYQQLVKGKEASIQ